ncbi:MAG: hypothetical protein KJZ86_21365 [Caldilineaceae bacterium]|nr:hypothetical protein [Caldilineaceae bacterium]
MSLTTIHAGLAQSTVLFMIILGVWAFLFRLRSRPLDGSWYGGAAVAEIVMVAQFALGWILYGQGLGENLPRAFVHILYGAVAVITLPTAYAYLSKLEDEDVKSVLFSIVCFFLMEVVIRARDVAIV